jgi:hypothetical protein
MNFNKILHDSDVKYYQEIGAKEAIQFVKKDNDVGKYTFDNRGLSKVSAHIVDFASKSMNNAMMVFIRSRMFIHPKVFKPVQLDFELLEQMTLNIEFQDYVQSFETITIELPDNYVQNKKIETYVGQRTDWPKLVTIYKGDFGLVCCSTRDSGSQVVSMSVFKPDAIIEDHLIEIGENVTQESRKLSVAEYEVEQQIIRAALNFCLLVDEVGSKNLGPNNPSHYARMQRRGESTKNIPLYYELNQHVPLFKIVKDRSELGEPTGRHVSPHHRRGHYRMQNYKEGRKRIRIPAIFVNGHRFLGNNSTYTAE